MRRAATVARMKSKIVVTLFALPFFAVGVWMLWSVSSSVHDAWRMQEWVPVDPDEPQASIIDRELRWRHDRPRYSVRSANQV